MSAKKSFKYYEIQNDFFLTSIAINEDKKDIKKSKRRSKSEKHAEKINYDLISTDKEANTSGKMKAKLITSKYFNGGFDESDKLVTKTIINKSDYYTRGEKLFRVDNIIPKDNTYKRRLEDEGHFVGEPIVIKYKFVQDMINESDILWNCAKNFDKNESIKPIELINCKMPDISTRFVPPLFFHEYLQSIGTINNNDDVNSSKNKNILEIFLNSIQFNHHPLFSIEHVFEKYLVKTYYLYSEEISGNKLEALNGELKLLREKKAKIKRDLHDNSPKKIYNEENLRKIINALKKIRIARFKESFNKKKQQGLILALWKDIKAIRKRTGHTNTAITLEIKMKHNDINTDQQEWDNDYESELNDVLDELKCEHSIKHAKYLEKYKKYKKSNAEKPIKPVLEYDEDKLRNNLYKEMIDAFRQPGEPLLFFEMKYSPNIITAIPNSIKEINRRSDVNKIKYGLKIYVNNKEVCKTKTLSLNHNFTVDINEKYTIYLDEKLFSIKIVVLEKFSTLSNNGTYNIIVALPEPNVEMRNDVNKMYTFKTDKIKGAKESDVGSGFTLSDIIRKYYSELNLSNVDVYSEKILDNEGELSINAKYYSDGKKQNLISMASDRFETNELTFELLSSIFDTVLDPNDPKNALLLMYFDDIDFKKHKKTENFYFDSDLYLKFDDKNKINDKCSAGIKIKNEDQEAHYQLSSRSSQQLKKIDTSIDALLPNDVSSQIDLQRQNNMKHLNMINNNLLQQIKDGKEKSIKDLVTDIKYPTIRSITVGFLHPKKPLFYQSRQASSTPWVQQSTQKDYLLKLCIFKAFHLPNRQDDDQSTHNFNDEGIIKMVSLRPFVHINCQGQTKRTSTVVGSSPTWNEHMCFSVRFNTTSTLTFQLFDEAIENWLVDDRLEDSTIHYHYNIRWLASLKIPLINIFAQTKIEGTFLMNCPIELLGYKQNTEDKYPNPHVSYDSLKKEIPLKRREEIFISLYLELIPCYMSTISFPTDDTLNSNEVDATLQHLTCFNDNYKNQFPDRKLHLLVIDSGGKNVCITRFFHPFTLFDFNECLKKMFFNIQKEESISSKSSTPHRKKSLKASIEKEDIDPNAIQSILSINLGDSRRQSKSIRDTFEMRSLNETLIDDIEIPLTIKIQICARYVAMIPTYKTQSVHDKFVVLSPQQTLKLSCGSMFDHTILLMGYFLQLGIECWCVAGCGLPRGFSTYVLIRENISTNEVALNRAIKTEKKTLFNFKSNWKYSIYDASSGIKYDTKDSFCPLQKVHFVCNYENIWANIQNDDRCNLIQFNLSNSSDWRAVFQKGSTVLCPGPLSGSTSTDMNIYRYDEESTKYLRDIIEDKIRTKVQKWRGHRKTIWNRHCSKILRHSVVHWEKWYLDTATPKPKHSGPMQQLMLSYQIYGFPLNLPYTTIGDIVSAVKGTQLHLNEHSSVEFGLGVEIFSYPNLVYSVWIYFASITKK